MPEACGPAGNPLFPQPEKQSTNDTNTKARKTSGTGPSFTLSIRQSAFSTPWGGTRVESNTIPRRVSGLQQVGGLLHSVHRLCFGTRRNQGFNTQRRPGLEMSAFEKPKTNTHSATLWKKRKLDPKKQNHPNLSSTQETKTPQPLETTWLAPPAGSPVFAPPGAGGTLPAAGPSAPNEGGPWPPPAAKAPPRGSAAPKSAGEKRSKKKQPQSLHQPKRPMNFPQTKRAFPRVSMSFPRGFPPPHGASLRFPPEPHASKARPVAQVAFTELALHEMRRRAAWHSSRSRRTSGPRETVCVLCCVWSFFYYCF